MDGATGRSLGELLVRLRNMTGLTQEELAAASGLSVRSISDLERGRVSRPRRRSVELLAAALGVDPAQTSALIAIARGAPPKWPDRVAGNPANVPEPAPRQVRVPPRQLPNRARGFAGRSAELKTLSGWLDDDGHTDHRVAVLTIAGPPGVGKTTLAVRWGHHVAERFPDGQLWVNLRGYDPAARPLSPAQAIRTMLDALNIPAGQVPLTLDAQSGLYRSLLAGRRILVVLDNARDTSQIRPLLPGSPGCLVVLTSRSKLLGLAVTEGARLLNLDVFTASEARQLLAARLEQERIAADPDAADELIRLCGRLPLALGIAAALASGSPNLQLADLAAHLRRPQTRLDLLDGGDPASSLRAVFSCSYQQLPADAARLFRLLGLNCGPDISVPAASSLAARPLRQVHEVLSRLTRSHLLTEHSPGRYAFHDLLGAYAQEQAEQGETRTSRHAALNRILGHYLHTAHAASLLYAQSPYPLRLPAPPRGVVPEHVASAEQALTWFEAEHKVLLAAVAQAAGSGFDDYAWQLTWTLAPFLSRRGFWQEWAAASSTALAAAQRLGNPAAQAHSRLHCGRAHLKMGAYTEARDHLQHALSRFRRLDDLIGQANAHQSLSIVFEHQGAYQRALTHSMQALEKYKAAQHYVGQAAAFNAIGWLHTLLGQHPQALTYSEQALSLLRESDSPAFAAAAWDTKGHALHHLGRHSDALACYRRSLGINSKTGDDYNSAVVLGHIADTHYARGHLKSARDSWHRALVILTDLEHPDAHLIEQKLKSTSAEVSPL